MADGTTAAVMAGTASAGVGSAVLSSSSASSPSPSSASSSSSLSPSLLDLSSKFTERFATNAAAARRMYLGSYAAAKVTPPTQIEEKSQSMKLLAKLSSDYGSVPAVAAAAAATPSTSGVGMSSTALQRPSKIVREEATGVLTTVSVEDEEAEERTRLQQPRDVEELLNRLPAQPLSTAAAAATTASSSSAAAASTALVAAGGISTQALVPSVPLTARQMLIASKREIEEVRPEWHAPWKLMRIISSHAGWVRAIAVDHSNEWFATGSVDRTIKLFDLASGQLKLTLTGHISAIRGLCISRLSPYLFSIGEDKQVKCWDLEQNKVIRNYHGHLSGGYAINLLENQGGPNILVTGGRDSVGRVWDIRTSAEVAVLAGHTQTVASIQCQMSLPQVITGSHDTTIKLWDLRNTSEPLSTLTHHKKSVRALQIHPTEYTFTSGAGDNLKVFQCPEGKFLRNLSGHNATVNALAINRDNVLVSGADNGSLHFWDYKSGYSFQQHQTIPQPGSLDAESGIFAMSFDQTGSRLLTAEADKSIKVYKEDENATEETHPLNWKPGKRRRR